MSKKTLSLGLMSGTSLDGLDLALCSFKKRKNRYDYKILKASTLSYSEKWKKKLETAQNLSSEDLLELHSAYGKFLGEEINKFLKGIKNTPGIISSHGHTIFHQPQKGFTLQIGSGAHIAAVTGITTVCDFRSVDVALDGQGAPLVPIGDEMLFSTYASCLNLGGIANISFRKKKERIAFDICAVNIVINFLAEKMGLKMDEDGKIAAQGKINQKLLKEINNEPFYHLPDKKSIGREWVEEKVLKKILSSKIETANAIATFTEHAAFQIASVIKKHKLQTVLATGGGVFNKQLIKRISELSGAKIILPEKQLIDFKEALIFALLGVLRMNGEVNTLKSVTGAKRDSCGGSIYQGNKN